MLTCATADLQSKAVPDPRFDEEVGSSAEKLSNTESKDVETSGAHESKQGTAERLDDATFARYFETFLLHSSEYQPAGELLGEILLGQPRGFGGDGLSVWDIGAGNGFLWKHVSAAARLRARQITAWEHNATLWPQLHGRLEELFPMAQRTIVESPWPFSAAERPRPDVVILSHVLYGRPLAQQHQWIDAALAVASYAVVVCHRMSSSRRLSEMYTDARGKWSFAHRALRAQLRWPIHSLADQQALVSVIYGVDIASSGNSEDLARRTRTLFERQGQPLPGGAIEDVMLPFDTWVLVAQCNG